MKLNIKKKGKRRKPKTPKETYVAKSFVRNLNKSLGKNSASRQPEKADKIFKINNLVDLRLIQNKTYIYVDNLRFVQCFNVLLNIGEDISRAHESIKNMDQANRLFKGRYGQWFAKISPEEEFMAHCSNIQAFFENQLNTDILHTDVAFPLLGELVNLGYKPAESVFSKEIVKRYNTGTRESRRFLILEGYLNYLNKEEKKELKKEKHLHPLEFYRVSKRRYREIDSILDEYNKITQFNKKKLIKIFEFEYRPSKFKEVEFKYPLSTLLDSDKINENLMPIQ